MITPTSIRQKAANQYATFVKTWLMGESFFPFVVRASKALEFDSPSASILAINQLRDQSKSVVGRGYSVEWVERVSRTHGKNKFPQRIVIETEDDFLWLAGKTTEFTAFSRAVSLIRQHLPQLDSWMSSHISKLTELSDQVAGLVEVVQFLKEHPCPDMFARELPLAVPTKFIELNQGVLREWLDIVLPAESISAAENRFERRYGLRYAKPHLLVRTLDESARQELGLPWSELSLPASAIAAMAASNVRVFVVENRVNALTLPPMPRSIVLGGLGDAVILLQDVLWLAKCELYYWGDIDAEGFEALSALRSFAPEAKSLFMDREALESLRQIISIGTGVRLPLPLLLSDRESSAYEECCRSNLRVEQERVPQSMLMSTLRNLGLL